MTKKCAYVTLLLAALAAGSFHAQARDNPSPLVPPNAHAYGKSFDEWNVLYTQWAVATQLGGQTLNDTVGQVRFLPNPVGAPGTYEFDVTLRPGTPFVAAPFPVFGETYDTAPPDDPNDPILDDIFDATDIRVVLDGRTLMDDTAGGLRRYQYDTTFFDRPIVYAQPQPRGPGLNSTSAIFTLGVGAVYHPLPVGRHTLVNATSGPLGDYQITYHITVSPH